MKSKVVNPVHSKKNKNISRMGGVKITIKNFQKKIPVNPKRIKKTILKVLSQESATIQGEITICFVNDSRIRALNLKYLHKDRPTDVLAFNLSRRPVPGSILADIVISTDTAIHNAGLFHTDPLYELNLYAVHGLLHLLGYDDKNPKQRKIMQEKTENILNADSRKSNPSTSLDG